MESTTTTVDMKLEAVIISVSDVDRAKAFYQKLGWRLDLDLAVGDFRGIQVTPHNSNTSVIFGKGITSDAAGSSRNLLLAVQNIDVAREDLLSRGVDVSEVFHFAAGPFNTTVANPRVSGRDPENRSYFSFASFPDPDGNSWLLQEVTTRFPGREWTAKAPVSDVASLAELLRETAEQHDHFEKTHAKHDWWNWYAPYLSAREGGSTPDEAVAAANSHNKDVPLS